MWTAARSSPAVAGRTNEAYDGYKRLGACSVGVPWHTGCHNERTVMEGAPGISSGPVCVCVHKLCCAGVVGRERGRGVKWHVPIVIGALFYAVGWVTLLQPSKYR